MQISDFHHANHVGGIDHRPDWRSLSQFGDPSKIRDYMATHEDARGRSTPIRRIVILEDFVGSGTQMLMGKGSVAFAAREFHDVPILLTPLIICPEGDEVARELAANHANLAYEPVLRVTSEELISPGVNLDGKALEQAVMQACADVHVQVVGNNLAHPLPYTPWGFRQTGCLVVLYSNTPANSLPLIHHDSNSWRSLFPRSARIQ